MQMRKVHDSFYVSGQIKADNFQELKDLGFSTIINNRPDGEMFGQPKQEELEQAAAEIGLNIVAIPMGPAGVSEDMVSDFADALAQSEGKVLAFCRSGTRSINLWALSQSGLLDPEDIISAGHEAGYNLQGLRNYLKPVSS